MVEKLRIAAGIMGEAAAARGARRIAAGRAARRTVAIEDILRIYKSGEFWRETRGRRGATDKGRKGKNVKLFGTKL